MPDWDKEMLGVGYAPAKADVDQALGDNIIALRSDFATIERLYLFVTQSIANGYLSSLGYTSAQIIFLNQCVNDLYTLWLVANGTNQQVGAYNFLAASEQNAGVK
jgi:hypothetical protein